MPTGTETAVIRSRYTREDPRGSFPRVSGAPAVGYNRLGVFWRPLVDLTDSRFASLRLRMIAPVSEWLARPRPERVVWFSRIGVDGLRRQVLRHAGLERYGCPRPQELPAELRTPAWERLTEALDGFGALGDHARALVVFHLAQLSFCRYATTLAGVVTPTGEPGRDQYAYQVARAHIRIPGRLAQALPVFQALAVTAADPLLALLACFQGIGHGIRGTGDLDLAMRFEEYGNAVRDAGLLADTWHAHLVLSRFHRAVALLRLAQRQPAGLHRELRAAWRHQRQLSTGPLHPVDRMIADENQRYLLELEIEAARQDAGIPAGRLRDVAAELALIDPNCVEARLAIGDCYVTADDHQAAARWYAAAGELGTASGAVGWYRAAQCHDLIGEHVSAVNAMGHCLDLDTTAIEPRQYLTARRPR